MLRRGQKLHKVVAMLSATHVASVDTSAGTAHVVGHVGNPKEVVEVLALDANQVVAHSGPMFRRKVV